MVEAPHTGHCQNYFPWLLYQFILLSTRTTIVEAIIRKLYLTTDHWALPNFKRGASSSLCLSPWSLALKWQLLGYLHVDYRAGICSYEAEAKLFALRILRSFVRKWPVVSLYLCYTINFLWENLKPSQEPLKILLPWEEENKIYSLIYFFYLWMGQIQLNHQPAQRFSRPTQKTF